MKKIWKKALGTVLCAALLAGSAGMPVQASNTSEQEFSFKDLIKTVEEEGKVKKDETVYVIAGADGDASKIIVSDWIKNPKKTETIYDQTGLSDVEVTKGDASYTMDGENMRVWKTNGEDVYYQGTTDKELPVTVNISYTLNGEAIDPDDLAGKSGHVTIRFDYENHEYEMREIDGKEEKIYVPFVMLTGLILDDDCFTNVEVVNGRLLNDGSHEAVVGIAFPGLKENLAVKDDEISIPDYVEISADVKDFSLTTTMTVATNEVFNRLNTEEISTDSLKETAGKLQDAFAQLGDGSNQLLEGLTELYEKSQELSGGVEKLSAGVKSVLDGVKELNTGAAQVSDGAAKLNNGLQKLSANSATLNKGAETVFNSLLAQANSQLSGSGLGLPSLTIGNYAKVLDDAIKNLSGAAGLSRDEVENLVRANEAQIKAAVTAQVKEQIMQTVTAQYRTAIETEVLSAYGFASVGDYEAAVSTGNVNEETKAAINASIEQVLGTKQAEIEAAVNAQLESESIKQTIVAKTEEVIQQKIEETIASAGQAGAAVPQLQALKSQLDSYNQFYSGLKTYTAGVDSAAAGAGQLKEGAGQLAAGTTQLQTGTEQLYQGMESMKKAVPALLNGVAKLKDGAGRLSGGLKTLDEEAVEKLTASLGDDLDSFVERLKATVEVAGEYHNFSGISDDMQGEVKFIYRTEGIGE